MLRTGQRQRANDATAALAAHERRAAAAEAAAGWASIKGVGGRGHAPNSGTMDSAGPGDDRDGFAGSRDGSGDGGAGGRDSKDGRLATHLRMQIAALDAAAQPAALQGGPVLAALQGGRAPAALQGGLAASDAAAGLTAGPGRIAAATTATAASLQRRAAPAAPQAGLTAARFPAATGRLYASIGSERACSDPSTDTEDRR